MRRAEFERLVVAELRKLLGLRSTTALLLAQIGLVLALSVTGMVHPYRVDLATRAGQGETLTYSAGVALRSVFALLLGVLVMAGEYRHGTVAITFLFTPRRLRVFGAKVLSTACAGLAFGLVAAGVTSAVVFPWLAAKGYALALSGPQLLRILSGAVVASVLFALMGLGLGALLRHQVAAVVLALVWMAFVDTIAEALSRTVLSYLPSGAQGDLLGYSSSSTNPVLLPMWAGALLLVGYATALLGAGSWAVEHRDVT